MVLQLADGLLLKPHAPNHAKQLGAAFHVSMPRLGVFLCVELPTRSLHDAMVPCPQEME